MRQQEIRQITVTHTVGNIEYGFYAQINYTVDIEEDDYLHPKFSNIIIDKVEYVGEMIAHDCISNKLLVVTNTVELAALIKSIDWEFELEKNL
jgi:IMP cyclohydrolase